MEYQKIINLLGRTIDFTKLPKYTTKNGLKFLTNRMEHIMLTKISGLKRHN